MTMAPKHEKAAHRIVERTTYYYHRRWARSLSEDDIRQQAWLIVLEAAQNPKLDVSRFNAYVSKAVSRSLGRYCWQQASPVSQTYSARKYTAASCLPDTLAAVSLEDQILHGESLALIAQARHALKQRMTELYNETANVRQAPNPRFNASVRVLLDNVEPQCAAAEEGAPASKVYGTTQFLKKHIAKDALAMQLLTIIAENRALVGVGSNEEEVT